MMTQDRDYEDILRDALRAAAESVEPASDGLERVRHRLHSPRSAHSVLTRAADWLRLYRIRLSVRLESFRWELSQEASEQPPGARSWPAQLVAMTRRAVAPRPRRGRRGRGQHAHRGRTPALGPAAAWFRPAFAVAGVVAVVAVGVFALNRVQQTEITSTNSVTSPGHQSSPANAGSATPKLWQQGQPVLQPSQQVSPASTQNAASSSSTCSPTPTPSKTPKPTASASVTPTPTPSDTWGATPSATPTGSGSPLATPTSGSGSAKVKSTPRATTDVMLSPSCGGTATPKATDTAS